jgi:hypothetical protein
MNGYDAQSAESYILSHIDTQAFKAIRADIPAAITAFIAYDLQFIKLNEVPDAPEADWESAYDEDDAFEYIFDAYLADFPCDEDTAMVIATLLDRYMELQYEYRMNDAHR